MTFQDAQVRLLAHVRDRIRNGELTERGFARSIGISQPHAHNVLKGVRKLSPKSLDAILRYFHLSVMDLASFEELNGYLQRKTHRHFAEAAFLETPIGPGMPWPAGLDLRRRFPLPFPSVTVPAQLAMADLLQDAEMGPTLGESDIGLLDVSELSGRDLTPEGLYAVVRRKDAVLRYLRPGARAYYLVSDATLDRPEHWERAPKPTGERVDFVKARVRWLGRRRDRDLPAHQRGRFLYDAISS